MKFISLPIFNQQANFAQNFYINFLEYGWMSNLQELLFSSFIY